MLKKIFIMLLVVLFFSCSGNGQKSVSKDDVVAFMDKYFEEVKQNEFSLIEQYYSEAFYKETSKEKWNELYTKIHDLLGELISVELESWNMKTFIGTSGSGTTYSLVYKNKYENGDAIERITVFVPKKTNEIKINGHNYNSDAFLKL